MKQKQRLEQEMHEYKHDNIDEVGCEMSVECELKIECVLKDIGIQYSLDGSFCNNVLHEKNTQSNSEKCINGQNKSVEILSPKQVIYVSI